MTDMIEHISKALLELKYNVKFTKSINNETNKQKTTDSLEVSKNGKEMMKRKALTENISERINNGKYEITEEMIDSIAEKIAKSLL